MNNSAKLECLMQNREQLDSYKSPMRYQLDLLFDEGSFVELGGFFNEQRQEYSMSVVAGYGSINQRLVYAYAQDLCIMGGTLNRLQCEKICRLYDAALSTGAPMISIINSGGACADEGVATLVSFGKILNKMTEAHDIIPQITVITGDCTDCQAVLAASGDFTFMLDDTSTLSLNTPRFIQLSNGGILDTSAYSNACKSGQTDFICANFTDCAENVRKVLNFLPMNYLDRPLISENDDDFNRLSDELNSIIPDDDFENIDIMSIIKIIADNGNVFQVSSNFATNIVTCFAHLGGHSVGIVANNGELDIDACIKTTRFIKLCDKFHIPIITLVDIMSFVPNVKEEYSGIVRISAILANAYNRASVPKISVVLRKAYGSAYLVMGGKFSGADLVFAWPTAEFAMIHPHDAVMKLYANVINAAVNPEDAFRRMDTEYRESFCSPYIGAENGQVDDIIIPSTTRPRLVSALEMLTTKQKKRKDEGKYV
ncbi:MAG: methylmalonyl-CoA carboxyltransferase [Clostridiales bacterium]|nr:methylmalonyl-CoA carboxyltransferase [Clostridiales bacterium]